MTKIQWEKIIIGFLVLTLVAAVVVGIYDATRPSEEAASPVDSNVQSSPGERGTPQQQSLSTVGDPWNGSGTIVSLDDVGLTLELDASNQIYVELGPPTYWQAQGVTLAIGDQVAVEGFFNGEQVHAGTVTTADGQQLTVRTAEGNPLWAGSTGASASGEATSEVTHEVQLTPRDWTTLTGSIVAIDSAAMTLQTDSDETLDLRLGPQGFWESQGVPLAIGDEISILGFWQSDQFEVGEITKLATGERLMLLDPNGRPLWAGRGTGDN